MYQIVNGIPRPVEKPLEKIDYAKVLEQQKQSPFHQFMTAGMSQKEALIACLNLK